MDVGTALLTGGAASRNSFDQLCSPSALMRRFEGIENGRQDWVERWGTQNAESLNS